VVANEWSSCTFLAALATLTFPASDATTCYPLRPYQSDDSGQLYAPGAMSYSAKEVDVTHTLGDSILPP